MMRCWVAGSSRIAVLAMVLAVSSAACTGSGDGPLEIGVERSALDLVFKETTEEDDDGPPPDVGGEAVPEPEPSREAPEEGSEPVPVRSDRPSSAPVESCPEADPGVNPDDPVTSGIAVRPSPGVYGYHNEGTFEFEGLLSLTGPYPPETTREIKILDHPEGEKMRFKAIDRGFGDEVVEKTYRVTGADGGDSALQLVRLFETSDQDEMTFEPTPPVTIVGLGEGEGHSWSSAGMDPDTGMVLTVQGEIKRRERVDACGEVYDTYRVTSDESMVNLSTGFRRETEEPTIYNVATQLGGLFLHEEVHSSTTWQTESGPVTLNLDYVSTADSAEPTPAP